MNYSFYLLGKQACHLYKSNGITDLIKSFEHNELDITILASNNLSPCLELILSAMEFTIIQEYKRDPILPNSSRFTKIEKEEFYLLLSILQDKESTRPNIFM